ncbi:hypothetical protein [Streptomyces sp. NPDC001404]|uniref:hypothetical protein n=1 Tax=Streptomyces sp. NPDC001404 TaxID=3364571 RepID=UPI00367CF496
MIPSPQGAVDQRRPHDHGTRTNPEENPACPRSPDPVRTAAGCWYTASITAQAGWSVMTEEERAEPSRKVAEVNRQSEAKPR